MARIEFLKEGESSKKKGHILATIKHHNIRKKWKRAFIISAILNGLLIIASLIFYFKR